MKDEELIQRFASEVLQAGPESSLPCNLSDEWLDVLSRQAEEIAEGKEEARMTELLAAVLHIIAAKRGREEVHIDEDELLDYLDRYRIELAIEAVSRRTDIKGQAADLQTIFTDRDVEFVRAMFPDSA